MRRSLLAWLGLLIILGFLPYLLADPRLPEPTGDAAGGQVERQVEQWIKDLGSDSFEKREAATHALMNLVIEPPGLHKALKSPDLEVRGRVARIFEMRFQNRVQRGLGRACILAKEGRVDEMVERLVFWREWIKAEKEWKAVAELAVRLIEWEHRTFGNTSFLLSNCQIPFPSVYRRNNFSPQDNITSKELTEMWTRVPHHIGHEFDLGKDDLAHNYIVILATETVNNPRLLGSIIISSGNIRLQSRPAHSIIICGESFEVSSGIQNCLVIVRGKVICHKNSKIVHSTIVCGGPVSFSEGVTVENAAICSGDAIACPKGVIIGKRATLSASVPDSPVKFFDPVAAGLTVWQVYRNNGALHGAAPLIAMPDGSSIHNSQGHSDLFAGVEIKKVRKGTLFATHLREGDVITAIGEKKTPTKELFRKVLRRKLAEGGTLVTFTVRRAGETLEVPIPVKD